MRSWGERQAAVHKDSMGEAGRYARVREREREREKGRVMGRKRRRVKEIEKREID